MFKRVFGLRRPFSKQPTNNRSSTLDRCTQKVRHFVMPMIGWFQDMLIAENPIFKDEEAMFAIQYLISCDYDIEHVEHAYNYFSVYNKKWKENNENNFAD